MSIGPQGGDSAIPIPYKECSEVYCNIPAQPQNVHRQSEPVWRSTCASGKLTCSHSTTAVGLMHSRRPNAHHRALVTGAYPNVWNCARKNT